MRPPLALLAPLSAALLAALSAHPARAQVGAPAVPVAAPSVAPTPTPSVAPTPTPSPRFPDEADQTSLLQALDRTLAYLKATGRTSVKLLDRDVPVERLRRSVARFRELVQTSWGTPEFERALQDEFEAVAMPGKDGKGSVLFTGYHLPLLEAREKPDATFRYPLYKLPSDMLSLNLGLFRPALAGQTAFARVQNGPEGPRVLPYFSRAEIDDGAALANKNLEIAWVSDELARYQLMVQGSGILRFPDGRLGNVNYAGQNGQPYASLGKFLIQDGKIPADQISMPSITAYFKAHPDQLRPYLNRNPSYVFFQLQPDGPFGCDGIALTPGRAIATDKRLFPSGAIAYIRYPRARFDASGQVVGWETGTRFVVDQDTGGAILGPGRVDIFWGGGEEAAQRAGTLNGNGTLTYFLLK
jgi:membrane-bound lytic murein transglycosylase A